jgi:hypothetical protein
VEEHEKESPGGGIVHRWTLRTGRFTATAVAVLLILYAALLVIPRTRGFRYVLEERLTSALGAEVSIESSSMTPSLQLLLDAIRVRMDTEFGEAGLVVEEAEINWSLRDFLVPARSAVRAVAARNGSLTLVPGAVGAWEPARLAGPAERMLDVLGIDLEEHFEFDEPVPGGNPRSDEDGKGERPRPEEWSRARLSLVNGSLTWRGYEGERLASASGLTLKVTPLDLSNRRARHVLLEMDQLVVNGDIDLRDARLEWIAMNRQQVLLGFDADWRKGKPPPGKKSTTVPALRTGTTGGARPDRAAPPRVSPKQGGENNAAVGARIRKALEEAVTGEEPGPGPRKIPDIPP